MRPANEQPVTGPQVGNCNNFASAHYLAHSQSYMGQMDKIPWHCTTAGLDNSTELQTVKIHPVVDEICIPTHGKAHMGQMRKWPWWCTTTGLKFFKELWTEKIHPVVSETCALAHGQAHMGQMWKTLRNYKSRQFHRALNGENPSNSFRFTFWPMGGPLWVKWAIMG